jgi:raffinose/stachyose/melibiose transport system permease protein
LKRDTRDSILFLLPALVTFGYAMIYPLYFNIWSSFYQWSGFGRQFTPVGLFNYVTYLSSPSFLTNIENMVFWVTFFVTLPILLGFALAVLLSGGIKGSAILRAMFYLPQLYSGIIVGVIWLWMLAIPFGLIPGLFAGSGLGFVTDYVFSLIAQWPANATMAIISLWQGVGFPMVVFLAGLNSVNPSLMESAKIDGAGALSILRHITIPSLRPFFAIVITLGLLTGIKYYDLIVAMTGGGPAGVTQTMGLTIYVQAFTDAHYGYASAVSNLLFVLTAVPAIVYISYYLRREKDVFG